MEQFTKVEKLDDDGTLRFSLVIDADARPSLNAGPNGGYRDYWLGRIDQLSEDHEDLAKILRSMMEFNEFETGYYAQVQINYYGEIAELIQIYDGEYVEPIFAKDGIHWEYVCSITGIVMETSVGILHEKRTSNLCYWKICLIEDDSTYDDLQIAYDEFCKLYP